MSEDRVINPAGEEVFGKDGLAREFVDAGVASDGAVGRREQPEIPLRVGVDRDVAAGEMAASRGR